MTSPHCSFATKIKMEAQSGSELKTSSSDSHRLFLLANPSFHLPLHPAMLVELTNTLAIADAVPGVGWHFHVEAFVVLRVAYGLRRFEFSRIFKIEETFCAVRHEMCFWLFTNPGRYSKTAPAPPTWRGRSDYVAGAARGCGREVCSCSRALILLARFPAVQVNL